MRFSDIVQNLQIPADQHSLTSHPDSDPELTALASVEDAAPSTFSYIDGSPNERYVAKTEASALVLPVNTELQQQASDRGIAWIATSQPKLVFAQAIRLFYQPFHPEPEIHPTAVIHPSAQIGKEVYIGPHVVIQADVTLGDRVCIHPNVTIYPGVQIGDRTLLHANCVIHERTRIGADCVIHSGAVLGSEGFGFVPTATGWFKMEQTGCTILEDGVEVGCNSTIDRAAIGETRIGRNTKIDNMVHIAHGCKVGEACAFAGQVGMAGSVTIGNRVIFAGQV
ncbi:MAG: UDP-3-O-(3-hydroxymyristoyl)glucosamine N-acyltransferase, partial [Leptolyngbyaceae cyanobacterium bins.59]|nr:UDP-3-O-(3-hydroxymyristoyl)glucosamine N-acyltransferase [Leptolyngbyaceae cyanobacterium bins.59]